MDKSDFTSWILIGAAITQLLEDQDPTIALGAAVVLSVGIDLFEKSIYIISPETGIDQERLHQMVLEARQASDSESPRMANQHVISKRLLQEFCNRESGTWRFRQYSLEYGLNRRPVSPSHVAAVKNFVKIDSGETEKLWSLTETNLPDVLETLQRGTLFDDPKCVQTVRDTIAVHFARSFDALELHQRIWGVGLEADPETEIGQTLDYEQMFFERFQIHAPTYGVARRIIVDEMIAPTRNLFERGVMFRLRVVDLFQRASAKFSQHGLQVLRVIDDSEFLIGDVPSLTLDRNGQRVGLLGGVPLFDAQTVIMPLGPHFAVSLSRDNEWVNVDRKVVDRVNRLQVLAAQKHVYFRSGSGLDHFVTEVRPPRNPRLESADKHGHSMTDK